MIPLVLLFFRRAGSLILFLLLVVAAVGAARQPVTSQPVPLTSDVRMGKLPNGLTYYVRPNTRPEGRVELRLVVNAGSILEDADQLGAAHFIEHMSFNGTRRFPKNELVSYLQSVGVRLGGDLNATTGFDETIYVLPIPSGDRQVLETGLGILREWTGNASLTDDDIEAERGVVLAELHSGRGADDRVQRQSLSRMFNGSRYAARLPIGTDQSLRALTPDALRRFYRDWYRPDLEAVIVVGDVNVDEIEQRIKALFADVPAPANRRPRPRRFEIPRRTTLDALIVTDPELPSGRVSLTQYVRPQPSGTTVADYDALLRDHLVNRMFGMRLYELTDRPVRPFLAAQAERSQIVRGYEAFAATALIAGQDPVETTKLLATEIERARRFGFTSEELDAAKRAILNTYAEANAEGDKSESRSLAAELGRNFLTDEPVPGIAWEYGRVKEVVPALTLDAVNAHARLVFEDPGSQPFVLVAAPSAAGATDAAVRRALNDALHAAITPYQGVGVETRLLEREPQPGRLVSKTADAALGTTTLTFANGVRVVLKETDFKNDEVLLSAGRYGGQYVYDQPDHQNAMHLIDTIDAMGYGSLTPTALQRFVGTRNADAGIEFGPYTEEVDGRATRGDISTLLQLVHLKLTAPRLDVARFEAARTALKGYLTSLANSPETQFDDFTMAVLSQNHPRAQRVAHPADLDQVNAERSLAMYRERFGNASGMSFVLVGSFATAEVTPLVARYLGGLPAVPREARFRDVGVRYPSGVIDRALQKGDGSSAAAFIYSGQRPYSATERLKLSALTEVLRLRVIDRIREQLGTSYSPDVTGQFTKVPVGQYSLRFSVGCAPDQVPVVERVIAGIIHDLQANGPTAAELEKVTRTWLNEYNARTKTNQYWAGRLRTRALDTALDDDGSDFVGRVKALGAADVQAAALTYADPTNRVRLVLEPEYAVR